MNLFPQIRKANDSVADNKKKPNQTVCNFSAIKTNTMPSLHLNSKNEAACQSLVNFPFPFRQILISKPTLFTAYFILGI